jgi:hypothetical protein
MYAVPVMQAAPTPVNWKEVWENAEHIATVLGIGAAGVWGYFNFIKSRTYYPRMEMSVSGEIRASDKRRYLIPRITLKNIGNSKIALVQKGSGYRVWVTGEAAEDVREVEWSKASKVYSMFENHHWIEPGESIFDEVRLLPVPGKAIAAKIEARLVAQVRRFPKRKTNEWNSSAILGPVITTQGGNMNPYDPQHLEEQQTEDNERTNQWERDKDRMQREEDPERSREWEHDKKDETK